MPHRDKECYRVRDQSQAARVDRLPQRSLTVGLLHPVASVDHYSTRDIYCNGRMRSSIGENSLESVLMLPREAASFLSGEGTGNLVRGSWPRFHPWHQVGCLRPTRSDLWAEPWESSEYHGVWKTRDHQTFSTAGDICGVLGMVRNSFRDLRADLRDLSLSILLYV